ncbi:hypothetical protein CFD26_102654 [Aspergillus turcosus]|uniref:Uncharacterized protein n=1 Tax=Aspergillus turcosus TaxID=1245748 RepID=A0A421D0Y4_9EURO|nr:hypothetical protein CFD26_102654 [Aspergillus turcosus]
MPPLPECDRRVLHKRTRWDTATANKTLDVILKDNNHALKIVGELKATWITEHHIHPRPTNEDLFSEILDHRSWFCGHFPCQYHQCTHCSYFCGLYSESTPGAERPFIITYRETRASNLTTAFYGIPESARQKAIATRFAVTCRQQSKAPGYWCHRRRMASLPRGLVLDLDFDGDEGDGLPYYYAHVKQAPEENTETSIHSASAAPAPSAQVKKNQLTANGNAIWISLEKSTPTGTPQ